MIPVFLHGLESSCNGKKGRWFSERFPEMLMQDFSGSLPERMEQLELFLAGKSDLVLIGSSYGGLMAAVYAIEHPPCVTRIVLLAPALNFQEFSPFRARRSNVPVHLYVGAKDVVCPADLVIQAAGNVFTDLVVKRVEDDHLLHDTFSRIDWISLIK